MTQKTFKKRGKFHGKNVGETLKDTETWKNALPKDSSRAPISDGQGNVFQGMVSEKKKRKKWGELWKKKYKFSSFQVPFSLLLNKEFQYSNLKRAEPVY